jgi:hypothetical protein
MLSRTGGVELVERRRPMTIPEEAQDDAEDPDRHQHPARTARPGLTP